MTNKSGLEQLIRFVTVVVHAESTNDDAGTGSNNKWNSFTPVGSSIRSDAHGELHNITTEKKCKGLAGLRKVAQCLPTPPGRVVALKISRTDT
jgi:hypothetical protein